MELFSFVLFICKVGKVKIGEYKNKHIICRVYILYSNNLATDLCLHLSKKDDLTRIMACIYVFRHLTAFLEYIYQTF